jgi:hypothetical protein
VKATLPNVEPENITGFKSEIEVLRWIRYELAAWLYARRRTLEKKEAAN